MTVIEIIVLFLLFLIVLLVFAKLIYELIFAFTSLLGVVFVTSAEDRLSTMLSIPETIPGNAKIADLGSGDGTVLFAAAKHFPYSTLVGIEFNPILVRRSRKAIYTAGMHKRISIHQNNLLEIDLREFDLIFLYLNRRMLRKLEKKIMTSLKPGAQVVSNYFQFPNIKPVKTVNNVHLYIF